jgi:peptide/nickel transport system substrate-binding protein
MTLRQLATAVAVVVVTAACGGAQGGGTGSGAGHADLVVDQANAPATLDPGMQYDTDSYVVYRNIFDTLLHRDPSTLKVIPWVADSWRQASPTAWIFRIHKGIKFQDGSDLTAADVAFSLDRVIDPATNSPQYANFSAVKTATASGDTVTVTTKAPSATLLSYLTTLAIVPQRYVESRGKRDFNLAPIGSGPYKLRRWVQGSTVDLVANAGYWKGKPPFQEVTFRAVPNDASRVADLQSGKADLAIGLTPDDADQLKSASALRVLSTPTERVAYLAFNVLGPVPTRSLQLREAIAYAIDSGSIIKNLLHGYGKPLNEVLTPLSFGYDRDVAGFSYQPEKARELLAQSGYAGQALDFPTSPAYSTDLVQAIQGDLAKVGIKVNVVNSDQATYLERVQSPSHAWGSIRFGRWSCSCLDADGTIYPLFHSGGIWSSYSNPQFDTLVEQARTTADATQRQQEPTEALAAELRRSGRNASRVLASSEHGERCWASARSSTPWTRSRQEADRGWDRTCRRTPPAAFRSGTTAGRAGPPVGWPGRPRRSPWPRSWGCGGSSRTPSRRSGGSTRPAAAPPPSRRRCARSPRR